MQHHFTYKKCKNFNVKLHPFWTSINRCMCDRLHAVVVWFRFVSLPKPWTWYVCNIFDEYFDFNVSSSMRYRPMAIKLPWYRRESTTIFVLPWWAFIGSIYSIFFVFVFRHHRNVAVRFSLNLWLNVNFVQFSCCRFFAFRHEQTEGNFRGKCGGDHLNCSFICWWSLISSWANDYSANSETESWLIFGYIYLKLASTACTTLADTFIYPQHTFALIWTESICMTRDNARIRTVLL